jgi:hypothetical protein
MEAPRQDWSDHALSHVLDQLAASVHGDTVSVREVMDELGNRSFAALILVPALVSASPASAVPGVTTAVAVIVAIMVVQMLLGRETAWLPEQLAKRRMSSRRVCEAVGWLRRPVGFAERFIRPRLTFLARRPWVFLPLLVCLAITLAMPFLELIPTTGSIASVAIACFAAGLLTRDGALILVGLCVVIAVPAIAWAVAS